MLNADERALLWLNNFNITLKRKHAILQLFNSPSDMFNNFRQRRDYIIKMIDINLYNQMNMLREERYIDNIINNLNEKEVKVITYSSEGYPNKLINYLYEPPLVIYYKGNIKLLDARRIIAVIGSRHMTMYGKDATEIFSRDLSLYDFCIISGLARGADTIAHKECLKNDGNTIAVLGCGIDVIYPSENKDLYEEIAEKGLLMTEYPLGTEPYHYNFPQRNRIISALSDGVLVTEAGEKSGTMITANLAIDYGKKIFAVPGSIFSEMSRGTHNLIKQFSNIVFTTSINDILDQFNMRARTVVETPIQLDFLQESILQFLKDKSRNFSEIISHTTLDISEVINALNGLKNMKLIRQLPGNCYELQPK